MKKAKDHNMNKDAGEGIIRKGSKTGDDTEATVNELRRRLVQKDLEIDDKDKDYEALEARLEKQKKALEVKLAAAEKEVETLRSKLTKSS